MNNTKLQEGQKYEKYVLNIVKPKYKNAWLWNDVPNIIMNELGFINKCGNNCDDIGCDILAENIDNTYHYIQCKNYSTTGEDNVINV
jgi:hypothetical protein